jgi:hypothetical protein
VEVSSHFYPLTPWLNIQFYGSANWNQFYTSLTTSR